MPRVRSARRTVLFDRIVESGLPRRPKPNTMFRESADHRFAQLTILADTWWAFTPPRLLSSHRSRQLSITMPRRRLPVSSITTPSSARDYRIALKDLELREGGNMLGGKQSGFRPLRRVRHVLRMLEETVRGSCLGRLGAKTFRQICHDRQAELIWRDELRRVARRKIDATRPGALLAPRDLSGVDRVERPFRPNPSDPRGELAPPNCGSPARFGDRRNPGAWGRGGITF